MMQITSPFIGRPAVAHTFSFWARSEEPGMSVSMRMGPPSAQLWRGDWHKSISVTPEWTRYEHTVVLPPAPDMLYLARITSHATGTFWVDQVMVEVGETAGAFQPAGPVELHAVAARDFGLSFEEEPLAYRLAITGALERATRIEGTVLDLYGNETLLPPIDVPPASGPLTVLETRLPPREDFGSFLVTHRVLDPDGVELGKPAELLLHRVRQPRHWGRNAPGSAFGTHVHTIPANLRMAKALGFNWHRTMYNFNWSALEAGDGSWNLDRVDRTLELHRQNHLNILTHLGGVPEQHSVVNQNWDGANAWWRMTAAPRMDAMDGFEAYAYQLMSRAGDVLDGLEVWNEPFLPGFFVGDIQNGRLVRERPEVLLEMNRRVRRAADRAEFKGLLFWNAGPHYGESERAFDTAVRDLGGAEYVDGLTFHRYTNSNLAFPGDQFQVDLGILREVFEGKDALQHVWNSEGGHGLSEIFNLYRNVPPRLRDRADMQATQYVRYFLSNFAAGVEKVFIYAFFQQDGWISNYGYLNVDGVLSQIAPATSNMAWQLEDTRFAEEAGLSGGVHAHLYRGEEENVVVLLPTGRGPAVLHHLPRSVRVADVYGNPVAVPNSFASGLLYLRAPDLTLPLAAQLLEEAAPGGFDLPAP